MIERLAAQVGEHPKLDEWDPPLCGDIDIRIDSHGQWHSQGRPISRERLVRLFASVLRREADGEHYLVTPVEKWRLQVDDAPFVLTDLVEEEGQWYLTGPFDIHCPVNAGHPWSLENGVPYVDLWHGNRGKISRALYYRLAEQAEARDGEYGLSVGGQWCLLGCEEAS